MGSGYGTLRESHPQMSTATAVQAMPRPWERNATENDVQWNCFKRFRDVGCMNGDTPGRRIKTVIAQAERVDYKEMSKWSLEHGWKERATLYDMHLDSISLEATEKNIRDMNKRHIRQARLLQRFAGTEMGKLAAKAEERTHDPVDDAKPADVARIMETGAKLERLSSGESTEHTQTSTGMDLSKLSIEELKTLKLLQEKASA